MTKQSNGHHLKRASDEIVDITDDDDETNENDDDDDSEHRYDFRISSVCTCVHWLVFVVNVISLLHTICVIDYFRRYDTRKSHKNHNHQGYRGKKNDNNSSSITHDEYTHARSNRSNEKISSSDSLTKDIEQASTIRPQGKHTCTYLINSSQLLYQKVIDVKAIIRIATTTKNKNKIIALQRITSTGANRIYKIHLQRISVCHIQLNRTG